MGLFPLNPLTLEAFWFGLFANHGVLVTAALVLFGAHIPYGRAILMAKWVSLGFLASTFVIRAWSLATSLVFDRLGLAARLIDSLIALVILAGLFWAFQAARHLEEKPMQASQRFVIVSGGIVLAESARYLLYRIYGSSIGVDSALLVISLLLLGLLTLVCHRFSARQPEATKSSER